MLLWFFYKQTTKITHFLVYKVPFSSINPLPPPSKNTTVSHTLMLGLSLICKIRTTSEFYIISNSLRINMQKTLLLCVSPYLSQFFNWVSWSWQKQSPWILEIVSTPCLAPWAQHWMLRNSADSSQRWRKNFPCNHRKQSYHDRAA